MGLRTPADAILARNVLYCTYLLPLPFVDMYIVTFPLRIIKLIEFLAGLRLIESQNTTWFGFRQPGQVKIILIFSERFGMLPAIYATLLNTSSGRRAYVIIKELKLPSNKHALPTPMIHTVQQEQATLGHQGMSFVSYACFRTITTLQDHYQSVSALSRHLLRPS